MKDTVCKEYEYDEIIPYHLEFLSKGMELFAPISFQIQDNKRIKVCYDLSNMNPFQFQKEGVDAPYIASYLIHGMRRAMDKYIFPNQYFLEKKVAYILSTGRVRLAYVPIKNNLTPPKNPGSVIRNKVAYFLEESPYSNHIHKETVEVLRDESIGMDTCIRRIEKLKEEIYYLPNAKPGTLDLYGKFI